MSLMSGLYVGAGGLQTSQNALHTTAHNLSNIETAGYTRQQVYLNDKTYNNIGMASISNMQTGLGVEYGKVRQVREYFLDQSYRVESGRSAFYETNYETINEIETLLGEFDGVAFQDSIEALWTSVQELQKDPASAVTEGSFVNTSAQFIERAQAVYNGLSAYQDNLNSRIVSYVDRINELGANINDLNQKITLEEIGEQEANDLRDARNYALDELSKLANISYYTNVDGGVEVMLEGTLFVSRDMMFKMGTTFDAGTGFYTPVWPQNESNPVYSVTQEISTEANTDIGQLKAILLARGDRRANYTDIVNKDIYNDGIYNKGMPNEEKVQATGSSIVMNLEAELDKMVHDLVVSINDILTNEDNGHITYTDSEDLPSELFVRLGTSRYTDTGSGYEYVEETSTNHSQIDNLYTIANLKVNPELLKTPTDMANGFLTADKQVNQEMADKIISRFSNTFGTLNPNFTQEYNYRDFYSAMVGQLASEGSVYHSIVEAQQVATRQLDDSRQSIMGVSSNEELSNMIKYQNAYNAASRYINACNEMLENMLSQLT